MSATEVKLKQLPKCSFCDDKAQYDFLTTSRQWAYGCSAHYGLFRQFEDLGYGKGQKLILDEPKQ